MLLQVSWVKTIIEIKAPTFDMCFYNTYKYIQIHNSFVVNMESNKERYQHCYKHSTKGNHPLNLDVISKVSIESLFFYHQENCFTLVINLIKFLGLSRVRENCHRVITLT
jgi:hypothetical protein